MTLMVDYDNDDTYYILLVVIDNNCNVKMMHLPCFRQNFQGLIKRSRDKDAKHDEDDSTDGDRDGSDEH